MPDEPILQPEERSGQASHNLLRPSADSAALRWHGTSQHRPDQKNRYILAERFRDPWKDLPETQRFGMLTCSLEGCLHLYHPDSWGQVISRMQDISPFDRQGSELVRLVVGGAIQVMFDAQWRFPVPAQLRDFAMIKPYNGDEPTDRDQPILQEAVYMVGMPCRIEIWSRVRYDERYKQMDVEALFEAARRLGLTEGPR